MSQYNELKERREMRLTGVSLFFLGIFFLNVLFFSTFSLNANAQFCGNLLCETGEEDSGNLAYCPMDCGVCGDLFCDPCIENTESCADCHCGDFRCDLAETASSCPLDCSESICGDLICDWNEICLEDCGEDVAPLCSGGPICGNGTVDEGEECDDGNTLDGDCCNSICNFDIAGSPCGDPSDTVCDNPDTCDGNGHCQANHLPPSVFLCRPSAGPCDAEEKCDGAGNCPADVLKTAGTSCRASAGKCDLAELCTGTSAACPSDVFVPSGSICRPVADVCDLAETCSGTSASCPSDAFQSGTTCRPAARDCDAAEFCSGTTASCPADGFKADGLICNDNDACTQTDTCQSGFCTGSNPVVCNPLDACHAAGTCDPANGQCTNPLGDFCNDHNACTIDSCKLTMNGGRDCSNKCTNMGNCKKIKGKCPVIPE